ncbi:MAG: MBL fold metallo-hydrolase [Gammaproteobacteria bacterium]|jgi:glyoxylase-like metal-dependent hydrolase (beta-lactamase superfamily II)|nr:MBL fold metallo-hydrolase [Gammaproteobacteria bacterium]MBT4607808.1 MBL fold metallo-hydrolase [Thiotrichales bacterium]MBT3472408.1 MBL fold metallo-hydrolase [Gammaproteobacteria bacterium]MBT4329368.1 MBL fold metallo-hydrolase [Gammaproteobacteria bacterium]MBT5635858.1 MBL fold metallo-hydrolase [Gammaproteobacteria bacterium]
MKTLPLLLFTTLFSLSLNSYANIPSALKVEQLADNIYALIGPTTNRTPQNLGNNANFGVVITDDGVVLIDSGATYQGAQMIHNAIRTLTDKPIKIVINTGGQDHRWLGNSYFQALGARIIASERAVEDQNARLQRQWSVLDKLVGSAGMEGTEPVCADQTFSDQLLLNVGATRIELYHAGAAHTPGDIFVWLPKQKIMFSGDIVYTDRMLGIGSQSSHRSWITVFQQMAAKQPKIVVGGHGQPANLAKATADTYDYLLFLRGAVQQLIDNDLGMEEIGRIDQSQFSYLKNYPQLKGKNAQRVYEELEWE